MADSGNRYMQGEGQHITYNFAFDAMVTRETGRVELVHLKELDLPQTNLEFGQNNFWPFSSVSAMHSWGRS